MTTLVSVLAAGPESHVTTADPSQQHNGFPLSLFTHLLRDFKQAPVPFGAEVSVPVHETAASRGLTS